MNVAFILTLNSKNKNYQNLSETDFFKYTLNTFLRTKNEEFNYCFYIGINKNDDFFTNENILKQIINIFNNFKILINLSLIENSNNDIDIYNFLFRKSFYDNYDYFYIGADNNIFLTKNWTMDSINVLKNNNNFGTSGPSNLCDGFLNNMFISRKHMEIYGFLLPNNSNLNWLSNNYKPDNLFILSNHKAPNFDYLPNNYYKKLFEYSKLINDHPRNILADPKKEFRYLCYNYLDLINKKEIPEIFTDLKNEAVLIEFRIMPHLEFLIRNAILKLNSSWSHTIVCGNLNYEYIKNICSSISDKIKIIKLNYDNLSVSVYGNLLASVEFWNLFVGEKILIYQEDTFIFKSNIGDFIHWDYIGAPWPPSSNNNPNNVGNGGFSLRTKQCMIDVINTINNHEVKYNQKYDDTPPEDVYFTKIMIENNIGKVADMESGYNFSHEGYINNDALGGHCFFLYNRKWRELMWDKIIHLL